MSDALSQIQRAQRAAESEPIQPSQEIDSTLLEGLLVAMEDLNEYAPDTYWISPGETVFERLWQIYVHHSGSEEVLQERFPQYCGTSRID